MKSQSTAPGQTPDAHSTEARALPYVVLDCLSDVLVDVGKRTTEEIRRMEIQHRTRLNQVLTAMQELVGMELNEKVRTGFETRFQDSMTMVHERFKEKLQNLEAESDAGRRRLEEELEVSREQTRAIEAELTSKEDELASMDREAELMLEDPGVEISKMIRHNAARNELKLYIKGLRFQVGRSTEE